MELRRGPQIINRMAQHAPCGCGLHNLEWQQRDLVEQGGGVWSRNVLAAGVGRWIQASEGPQGA